MRPSSFSASLGATLLASTLLLGGCAQNPVTGESDFVLMSEDNELALGRQTHAQVIERYGRYENPALQNLAQRIGDKLAANSHRTGLIYRFTVLDGQEVNAFALPGGYIYITRGLLAFLNGEDELAAVLGHEIGHVTARHSVRQYTAQQAANIGVTLGAILVPQMRTQNVGNLAGVLGTALLRGYGREHELEADGLGAEYLARAGYDPEAMLRVITVLKNQELFERERAQAENREPKVYHGVFSTHPDNDTRLREIVGRARALKRPGTSAQSQERFLRLLDGMIFGPSAREGVLRGHDFYHRDLGIALNFPRNWRAENLPDRLVATAPDNDGFLQVMLEDLNKRISPREFMRDRMGLDDMRRGRPINAGDLPGYTAVADANTPFGRVPVRFTVIFFETRAYIFAGAAKDERTQRHYEKHFLNTALSLHGLEADELALAEPNRLRVLPAPSASAYRAFAASAPLGVYSERLLRLLNGHYPDGEPSPGSLVKIVR